MVNLSRDEQTRLGVEAGECNREAVEKLYEHYHEALYGHIRQRIGNTEDAKDVAQDAWEYYYKKKHTYNPEYAFYTFLRNFARYAIMRYFVKRRLWNELFILISEHPELREEMDITDLAHWEADERQISPIVPPPDDPIIFKELLCLTLRCCAKPHQLIIFGFNRLLRYTPRQIVTGLSEKTLGELTRRFSRELCQYYIPFLELPSSETIDECFSSLESKLCELVVAVYTKDEYEELRRNYPHAEVSSTLLRDYLGKDPRHSISDWSNRVKDRVWQMLQADRTACGS